MLSEALDITITSNGDSIWLNLCGPFHKEQVPNIRAKVEQLIRDDNKEIIIDLEKVTFVHESVAPMFLSLQNLIKGKNGDIKLIFKNECVHKAFLQYKNIFSIYPDSQSISGNRLFHALRKRGKILTKKTGIRLSIPVALFLLFLLAGWFISLGIIINMQKKQILTQEETIRSYLDWKSKTELEMQQLRLRLKPLKQLGIIIDSIPDR